MCMQLHRKLNYRNDVTCNVGSLEFLHIQPIVGCGTRSAKVDELMQGL